MWILFLQDLPDGRQVNETEQKYQNLRQLLPGSIVIYLAILVYLQADTTATQPGTGLEKYP